MQGAKHPGGLQPPCRAPVPPAEGSQVACKKQKHKIRRQLANAPHDHQTRLGALKLPKQRYCRSTANIKLGIYMYHKLCCQAPGRTWTLHLPQIEVLKSKQGINSVAGRV
jgi:hypothetical protein